MKLITITNQEIDGDTLTVDFQAEQYPDLQIVLPAATATAAQINAAVKQLAADELLTTVDQFILFGAAS